LAHLTNGSTLNVDVQDSAWNDNTIHFVRVDVDASTGALSVDGMSHIRNFGQNLFGFGDLRADRNSDWDYNVLVMKLTMA
jgi:hypothetical protein